MPLLRHTGTGREITVPDKAVPYFPGYEPVQAKKTQRPKKTQRRRAGKTVAAKPTVGAPASDAPTE